MPVSYCIINFKYISLNKIFNLSKSLNNYILIISLHKQSMNCILPIICGNLGIFAILIYDCIISRYHGSELLYLFS